MIDQGIDITHPDLQANIWTNPSPGALGLVGDLHGYNFADDTGTLFTNTDLESHATHVAGIIGAAGNNSIGVSGVNWTVRLMSLKFIQPNGFGATEDAADAVIYAVQMRQLWQISGGTQGANVRVLNGSFGEGIFSRSFLDAD